MITNAEMSTTRTVAVVNGHPRRSAGMRAGPSVCLAAICLVMTMAVYASSTASAASHEHLTLHSGSPSTRAARSNNRAAQYCERFNGVARALAPNSVFTSGGSGPESQFALKLFTKYQLGFMSPPDPTLSAYNCHWRPASGRYANAIVTAQISIYRLGRPLSEEQGLTLLQEGGSRVYRRVAGIGDWALTDDTNIYSGVTFGKGNLLVLVDGDPNHTDRATAAAAKTLASQLP